MPTKAAAEQKNIRLEVSMPGELPQVLADEEKTAWVLTNLISNAIRYSYDNAAVHIISKHNAGKIEFTVIDTGQGIAPQYKEKIFDRYFRVPGTKKRRYGPGFIYQQRIY